MWLRQIGNGKSAPCMPHMPSSFHLLANAETEYTACHMPHVKSFEKEIH